MTNTWYGQEEQFYQYILTTKLLPYLPSNKLEKLPIVSGQKVQFLCICVIDLVLPWMEDIVAYLKVAESKKSCVG
jgi:hypothetical protein